VDIIYVCKNFPEFSPPILNDILSPSLDTIARYRGKLVRKDDVNPTVKVSHGFAIKLPRCRINRNVPKIFVKCAIFKHNFSNIGNFPNICHRIGS